MNAVVLDKYLARMVDMFFKILPIREKNESSLVTYMDSLQAELIGCGDLLPSIGHNPSYISLLAILQYLIDHPEASVQAFKREVFKAISLCNKLRAIYASH